MVEVEVVVDGAVAKVGLLEGFRFAALGIAPTSGAFMEL